MMLEVRQLLINLGFNELSGRFKLFDTYESVRVGLES